MGVLYIGDVAQVGDSTQGGWCTGRGILLLQCKFILLVYCSYKIHNKFYYISKILQTFFVSLRSFIKCFSLGPVAPRSGPVGS